MTSAGATNKLEIKRNDIVGRYGVAACDLEPGELILTETAFAYGPKIDSPPVCLGCYAYIDCSNLCSTCGWPVCDVDCEVVPAHKDAECGVFANAKVKFTPVENTYEPCLQYECITPLRVLLATERDKDRWENQVKCMETHTEERKRKEIWNFNTVNIVNFLRGPCKLSRFDEDLIHQVCSILDINSFEARTQSGNMIRCVYPNVAVLSHNCVSNITHSIYTDGWGTPEDYRVYLRAALPLKKGDELFAGYTYSMWPTIVRREYLREGKYFECNCQRCTDPTELGTHMSTLKCTKNLCDNGVILSTNPLDAKAEWKCTHCPNTLKGSTIRKVFKTIQEEIDQVESMPQDSMSIEARESLYRKYRSILHPRNAYFTVLRISLAQMYGKIEGYTMDVLPDVLYERKVELCQQILENINILEPGWSRLRGITMYELHAPIIMLARNLYNNDVIDKSELRAKLMEAIELLRESSQILILEPENSSEGMIGQAAMQAYQQLSANLDDLVENA
ncbi:set and mynd domain containing arthropod-specific member 4 isoform a [Holotrichia oblita]|uniref:Set and mynd domain containing arthropod-specific member 4 isoform a n=1 Tax=Holotrichia oblita TaxID=644536 RepID=A0ACB9TZ77_HOLOL|nr:set and mynd domain containing arthropod-specific member 4 isoform a [Holotrichia oblita]